MLFIVCLNFVLKQTYSKPWMVGIISMVCALFIYSMWPLAIEQSKTQLEGWLSNQALMLDVAVLLSIEVILAMSYCMLAVHLMTTGTVRRRTIVIYKVLRWFPGLLIFPVLFHIETMCMFQFTSMEFTTIALTLAVLVLVLIPLLTWGVKWLIPEKELRLEIYFLSNALIAILGIIATVNGRTAVQGFSEVNYEALLGIFALILGFGIIGFIRQKLKYS